MAKQRAGKHPGGRPTKYRPEYCQQIVDYFDVPHVVKGDDGAVANDLPTLAGFAASIDVTRQTLLQWCTDHPEFSGAYQKAKDLAEAMWATNALQGRYQTAFAIFYGKNCFGYRDKQEVEHSGEIGLGQILTSLRDDDSGEGDA
jgi:hypothetical protein